MIGKWTGAMRQELTADMAASRETVWAALQRDLAERGGHVDVLELDEPAMLRLVVKTSVGESLALGYLLNALEPQHTAVTASIEPRGPLYTLKRTLSFGAVDQGYLAAIATGLDNLRRFVEEAPPVPEYTEGTS
jgi:hypothetical protein